MADEDSFRIKFKQLLASLDPHAEGRTREAEACGELISLDEAFAQASGVSVEEWQHKSGNTKLRPTERPREAILELRSKSLVSVQLELRPKTLVSVQNKVSGFAWCPLTPCAAPCTILTRVLCKNPDLAFLLPVTSARNLAI